MPPKIQTLNRRAATATTAPENGKTRQINHGRWCSLTYLHPFIHPDDLGEPGLKWPRVIRRFVEDARRAKAGEFGDRELYCSDAQWAGLYDQMFMHTAEETDRRLELAAEFGPRFGSLHAKGINMDGQDEQDRQT